MLKKTNLPLTIELRHIDYQITAEPILNNLNLSIQPSTVHALVGKHGGGKSSLCKILSGLIRPNSGTIFVDGKYQSSWTLPKARAHGIVYIHQYSHLLEHLNVMENFLVSRRNKLDLIYLNRRKLKQDVKKILHQSGFNIDLTTIVRDLPLSQSVALSVILQLALNPRLLILDEILDRLDAEDQTKIISLLERHKKRGLSVLWITHNIDEVGNFADVISVFRKGKVIFSSSAENIDNRNLVKLSYNQISRDAASEDDISEFYNLLRYNEAILLHLPVNLLVIDTEKAIKLINHRGRKFFGVTPKLGRSIESLLGAKNQTIIDRIDKTLKSMEEITYYELPLIINSHTLEINLVIFPIIDGADYIGCILIIEDVTEKEYLRKQAILAERLSSLGLLAAGVAHEINNPLEVISNNLNYLRFDIDSKEKEEVLSELEEEVLHINKILKNIFLFSERQQLETNTFDLTEMTEKLLHLLRHNADKNGITIDFTPEITPIEINANPTEIREVLLNLVKNSFDALETVGKIAIDMSVDRETNRAIIKHKDNGCGIPEDILPDIFLPFSTTKQDNESNMGLGLSIVYNIIKKNSGQITVKNLPTGGCQFTITLPLKK